MMSLLSSNLGLEKTYKMSSSNADGEEKEKSAVDPIQPLKNQDINDVV